MKSSISKVGFSAENVNGITLYQQVISSSCGALLTSIFVTPLDVIKIRLQGQVKPLAEGECFLYSNGLMDHLCQSCKNPTNNGRCEWFNRPGHFNGTLDALVKITRNEGPRALWSGLSPTMISAIPATILYFTLYDNLHNYVRQRINKNYAPLISGTLARTTVVSMISPLELIRTKMQSEKHSYQELKSAITRSLKADGYKSLWKGCSITLLRDIPFSGIYWTCYELIKQKLLNLTNRIRTSLSISFISGALSGSIAATLTLPFDVVKTQRQITLGRTKNDLQNGAQTMISSMRQIVRTNGVQSLFTGLVPRAIKVSLACAIMISSYEYFKLVFTERNIAKTEN